MRWKVVGGREMEVEGDGAEVVEGGGRWREMEERWWRVVEGGGRWRDLR